MMKIANPLRLFAASLLVVLLGACDSPESRAARHMENAENLLASGDIGAATLELRNVLQNMPTDRGALEALAPILLEAGDEGAAAGLYRRLVENHPDAVDGWLTLAEIAIRRNDWANVETLAQEAETRAPDDERTALILAMLDFRAAIQAENAEQAAEAAAVARAHVAREPDSLIARQILIAHAGTFIDEETALAEIEDALTALPEVYALHQIRLQTLAALDRAEAIGPALEDMLARFPDEAQPLEMLVQWYIGRGNTAAVERVLRGRADAETAGLQDRLLLVNFLRELRGDEDALAELDRQIAALPAEPTEDGTVLRGLRATLLFDGGDAPGAIEALRAVLAEAPEEADTNNLRVALAQMIAATGDETAAMAEIDAVLANDSGHVEAGKIKARQLIDGDETDEAIRLLRQAQATDPTDADVLRLMGEAHGRAGNWALAGERYAQAVDLSNNAPAESLVYAEFLLTQGREQAAETVLEDALRAAPADLALLRAITRLQLETDQLDDARQGIARIRALDTDLARQTDEALEASALLREDRVDETQALVERMAEAGRGDAESLSRLIQARIRAGDIEAAEALLDEFTELYPEDPLLAFLRAGVLLVRGETEAAEAAYRAILADSPAAGPPLRVLYGLLLQQGRTDEAIALLEELNAAAPRAVLPRLLLAEQAERRGDADAAIALYEGLYADDSGNLVVANNLANLLMAREDDDAALDRAHRITRRLSDTEVPAFQHTFGWIAYLRGDYGTALEYIGRSAEALPDEPVVLLHLGMTHLALEQPEEARPYLERVLEVTAETGAPQGDEARALLEGI
jgi:predicted Zn-dependent protease